MSKVNFIQYMLAFIIMIFAMSSYLMFLAYRDSKLFQNYDSTTIESRVRE